MIISMLELVGQALYDTVAIHERPMRQPYHFFALPVGQYDPNQPACDFKTWLHTGQVQAGMLEAPNKFLASRLNVLFLENNRPLRIYETDLYCKTEISFEIMQKRYWGGPAWMCASPFALLETPRDEIPRLKELYGVDWERIGANLSVEHVTSPRNWRYPALTEPVAIETQAVFTVTARVYDEGPREHLQLAVHIDGTLARAVV